MATRQVSQFVNQPKVKPVMKHILTSILLLIAGTQLCSAQWFTPENKQWRFGYGVGLDFSSGSPSGVTSPISTNEGCATVSDASGSLLFFTDGKKVWDRSGSVMTSGSSIVSYSTSSSTQGALITPVIGSTTQYYVFSLEEYSSSTGYCHLSYSVVDMTLSSGMGDVVSTSRGISLGSRFGEKITAIQGTNCDLWVVVHLKDSAVFYAFNVSSSGISTTPVISRVGTFNSSQAYTIGVMKPSHNGQKLVTCSGSLGVNGLELYDFNGSTGVVSNCQLLNRSFDTYGAEFSPNDTLLYAQGAGYIYQYDITSGVASSIISTRYACNSYTSSLFSDLKLGPD
ncbi:MAG: hypothetical protein EBZ77_15825, partial [Chitinophagia bacterium]|nr:hypothetical protein [Chitinophagia bacterium]